ncbi:MAG: 2-phosphosulfolactate phosphatase [Bacteroidetes bacterium]|jgi:2-phosphosulfolactate phosphatase|nr:2-phosphosulfolactate phosphatase [Bacteroidota bacterium]MBT6686548.1 2-phosphosulfolactate phosphatase [Bacteroidota bacterium]MBT7142911.1 2-phosphosulfolactate phosphatase [Bacteroidota bacterium]MBT7490640.1 2-phosphosulfolactate phosphatase [Bacteroidota bacterium]
MKNIDVCLSPELYHLHENENAIVVVIDIIRATSSICVAFENGVKKVFPVKTIAEALEYKKGGFLISGERDSYKLEDFDLGNSPYDFMTEKLKGKSLAMTTTNGTQAIKTVAKNNTLVLGSMLNFQFLCEWLIQKNMDVLLLCSGWKNKINIEDSAFAGKIVDYLIESKYFTSDGDSANLVRNIYKTAKNNLFEFVIENSPRLNSKRHFLEKDIKFCLTEQNLRMIPIKNDNYIVPVWET